MSGGKGAKPFKVVNATLDLGAYIQAYSGPTALQRLLFVAEHCDGLLPQAATLLEQRRATSRNYRFYRTAWERLRALGVVCPGDEAWAEAQSRASGKTLEKLESELAAQRSSSNSKDAVRIAYLAMAEEHYQTGDPTQAVRTYLRARDFATTPDQHVAVHLPAARAALDIGGSATVTSSVAKLESLLAVTPPAETSQATTSSAPSATTAALPAGATRGVALGKVIAAIQLLQSRSYRNAGRKLLEVSAELAANDAQLLGTVASARDVALYGTLCSLATLDRSELKRHVVDNVQFRDWLEYAPDVRQLVDEFYAAHYTPCLAALERMRPNLLLDIHLHPHVVELLQRIRDRAITQYFSPYASVDMKKMSAALNTTLAELERDLARLIASGHIAARIDSQAKVLLARHTDQRNATFAQAFAAGDAFAADACGTLLRIDLLRNNFGLEGLKQAQQQQQQLEMREAGPGSGITASQVHQAFASIQPPASSSSSSTTR